ncbi:hypothetical protein MPER_11512 [Moniliophthora perniciosa FA553]|nr:hypothetical protein MPER_11512 [Moniliophthora perniciosa FA553]
MKKDALVGSVLRQIHCWPANEYGPATEENIRNTKNTDLKLDEPAPTPNSIPSDSVSLDNIGTSASNPPPVAMPFDAQASLGTGAAQVAAALATRMLSTSHGPQMTIAGSKAGTQTSLMQDIMPCLYKDITVFVKDE